MREKPTAARKPKEGSGIARLKIALLAGNGVDSTYNNYLIHTYMICNINTPLIVVKFEKKWAKVQALIRTRLQRKKYQRMGKLVIVYINITIFVLIASSILVRDVAYREKIAKEILSTEVVYVKALKACIDVRNISL